MVQKLDGYDDEQLVSCGLANGELVCRGRAERPHAAAA